MGNEKPLGSVWNKGWEGKGAGRRGGVGEDVEGEIQSEEADKKAIGVA